MKWVVKMLQACFLHFSFFSSLRRGLRFPPATALNISVWQWKLNHLLHFTPPRHLTSSSFDGALFSKSGSRYSHFVRSSSGVSKTQEGFEYHKRGSASKWRSCLQVLIQKELDESSAIISHYHGRVLLAPCCFSCQEEEKNEAPLTLQRRSKETDTCCHVFTTTGSVVCQKPTGLTKYAPVFTPPV